MQRVRVEKRGELIGAPTCMLPALIYPKYCARRDGYLDVAAAIQRVENDGEPAGGASTCDWLLVFFRRDHRYRGIRK